MQTKKNSLEIKIPKKTLENWQQIIDITAEIIGVPSALIMRLSGSDIEVFVTSNTSGNPYSKGDKEHFLGSGLYCETVINTNKKLLVPNALKDENWKNNPDIKLDMISYLGFPILFPDNKPFGTICVLDKQENAYSQTYESLILNFRDIIQSQLSLLYMNFTLGEENRSLTDYINELKVLRGIVPICASCKKIRDQNGHWIHMESYIEKHSEAQFSHGICRSCEVDLYGKEDWYKKNKLSN